MAWSEKSPLTDVCKPEVCERTRVILNSPLELTGKVYPSRGYKNSEKAQDEPGSCGNTSQCKAEIPKLAFSKTSEAKSEFNYGCLDCSSFCCFIVTESADCLLAYVEKKIKKLQKYIFHQLLN